MQEIQAKTILVTGGTDGIGRLAAERLARQGATVLIHGRDATRIDTTLAGLQEAAGHGRVHSYRADYASLAEVREMAQRVLDEQPRLDILINNAGIGSGGRGNTERTLSRDGHELRFQVNYLAAFLLTQMMLSRLRASAPARIVNVASIGQVGIDFDDVMLEHGFEGGRAYAQSKLAMIMFTFELVKSLAGSGVTVNALHPGSLLNTKMVRETFGQALGTAEQGAEAEVHLATSPEVEGVTGRYFDGMREARAHDQAYDPKARARLWELSGSLVLA